MIMIIDDISNPKITQLKEKNAHKLEIMIQANSYLIEGNECPISIHQILCEVYQKLFNIDCEITKTLSTENCNIIDVSLPIISYGKNFVQRDNINTFLKSFTNLDRTLSDTLNSKMRTQADKLEKLILAELPILLGLYTYYVNKKHSPLWKKVLKMLYQPSKTFRTYRKERLVLNEINEVFSITEVDECVNFILAVNQSIESYLTEMGGVYYCDNILDKRRDINSIDMMIYSAYKAQIEVFKHHDLRDKLGLQTAKVLVDNIDSIIKKSIKIKNEIRLADKNSLCVPRIVRGNSSEFSEFDHGEAKFNFRNEFIKKICLLGGFFGLVLLLKLKK